MSWFTFAKQLELKTPSSNKKHGAIDQKPIYLPLRLAAGFFGDALGFAFGAAFLGAFCLNEAVLWG